MRWLIFAVVLAGCGAPSISPTAEKWGSREEAIDSAQTFVRQCMKNPRDAEFPGNTQCSLLAPLPSYYGVRFWTTTGLVKGFNSLGGAATREYRMIAFIDGKRWRVLAIWMEGEDEPISLGETLIEEMCGQMKTTPADLLFKMHEWSKRTIPPTLP